MQEQVEIKTRLDCESLMPVYGSSGASGADVRAKLDEAIVCDAGESCLVPTGVFLEIPDDFEVQVRPRSGLAFKHQITVLNTPGTIDADYRGEIKVILINHGKKAFEIEPNMRIAQLVLQRVERAKFVQEEQLCTTSRQEGGFGSTGVR
jgi:dUTP pyrophosphatase